MTDTTAGQIGGIERQQAMMARWLAGAGYDVSMITWDHGGDAGRSIAGVRMLALCRQEAGLPGVRFVHPKWTSLIRTMRRADAHVYYQNCGEVATGQVAMWCRRNGRRFIYSVASDADCDARLGHMNLRERVLYRYGLRHADRVIVQTRRQQRMLRDNFGTESQLVPMPCAFPQPPVPPSSRDGRRVAWIGRLCRVKRPDRLMELARRCADVRFDVVGPVYDERTREAAAAVPNVQLYGAVPPSGVGRFYAQASLLVCTSDYEGFPNTFLEAWSSGMPVVSTVDPDDLIRTHQLGAVAGDVPALAAAIRGLLDDPELYRRCSRNAREYYLQHHTVDQVMPQFAQAFDEQARLCRGGYRKPAQMAGAPGSLRAGQDDL